MGLRDIELDLSYETTEGKEQLVEEFYIPVLQNANKYYRIAGFFSSTSLVVAAKGIEGLINNGGEMYLLISPELSEEDYRIIKEHGKVVEGLSCFSELDLDSNPHENLQALAWLLDCGKLKIKIVVGIKSQNSLFHQKVGIVFDENNDMISFSGSINETAQAWLNNIEEFKVFRSWESGQVDYLTSDLKKFISYWKNERQDIAEVYDVPEAIIEKIVKIKPRDVWDLNIMRRYRKDSKAKDNLLSLFEHQKCAVKKWKSNDRQLMMEMATGTGKTRTAIGCAVELLKQGKKLCIIISTPQIMLSQQWRKDFEELNIVVDRMLTLPGTYSSTEWRKQLELMLLDLSDDNIRSAVVFTTHTTTSSKDFISRIQDNKYDTPILFIADEVHAIGSAQQKKAMLAEYEYRVGLSATPERMFDESGTAEIREYFGNDSFEFSIADALHTINPVTNAPFLNQYKYCPIIVMLTKQETKQYSIYSRQIAILKQQEDYDPDELQRLYDKRAKICKDAENKYAALDGLLEELDPPLIQDTILFVSDKQIRRCFDIMDEKRIRRAKITESESAEKIVNEEGESERQEIISQFRKHNIQILIGMKCLDEGIDIKNARIAVLMANSTNPREYVQRIGRVIRWAPDKKESLIYDFIAVPDEQTGGAYGVLEKEANRARQIAVNAVNYEEVKRLFLEMGVQLDAN